MYILGHDDGVSCKGLYKWHMGLSCEQVYGIRTWARHSAGVGGIFGHYMVSPVNLKVFPPIGRDGTKKVRKLPPFQHIQVMHC